ncbi:hypothetical protein B0H14DRAFT_2644087 [Mycena olivaceomarginata]|nr:hypothetical protein B0H14DRAFT_2644087 [Mycena olivaceomarginata]
MNSSAIMVPAPKQKIAPEGCILSEDGKKVHCTLCTSISPGKEVWFAWASLSNHLKSTGHARAENQHKTRQIQAAAIERDRQNDLARRRAVLTRIAQSVPLTTRLSMEGRWNDTMAVVEDARRNLSLLDLVHCIGRIVEDEVNPEITSEEVIARNYTQEWVAANN